MAGSTSDIARWTNAAGTGNVSTAGNWAVEAGTPSTPPAAGEVALCDSRANGSMTAGLNHFASTTLGAFRVNKFQGNIGTVGSPLQVDATTVSIDGGGGTIILDGDFGTVNANALGGGSFYLTGGTTTTLNIQGGEYSIGAGAVVTTLRAQACNVTVADNGTAITTGVIVGSTASISRAVTTLTEDKGSKTYLRASGNTVGTLNVHGDSTHYHQTDGTVTTLNGYSGKFTPQGSPFAAVTVTTANPYNSSFELVDRAGGTVVTVGTRNDLGILED